MTKEQYVSHLRALYLVANASDSEDKEEWMIGDECATHCQQYDKVARIMHLGPNWLEE